ncbi:MAG: polysaccharide deacetylase family protein [Chitinophagaceae bacterium]
MESSASDDGDPGPRTSYYRLVILSFIFLATCTKPQYQQGKTAIAAGDSLKRSFGKSIPPKAVAKKQPKKKKKIYLTFDDGPNKGTQNVLDIVQQENVPATFFIVGEHVFASLEQARTWDSLQHADNIEICNHSYTHAHNRYEKFYQNPDSVVKDIDLTQEKLHLDNNIVRAPGRNSWRIDSIRITDIKKSRAAMDSLQNAGFVVMGWDLEWHYDPKTLIVKNTADELLNQVDSIFIKGRTKTTDHLVLLAHDQVYHNAEDSLQLRQFVQKLKLKDEYELSLVSSYPGVKVLVDTVRPKVVSSPQ